MAFENLTEKLSRIFKKLRGQARLTESNMDEMLKEIRIALLEADVNYKIVKQFITDVKEKAVGERVLKSLTPGDQVVKIVYEELVKSHRQGYPFVFNLYKYI